MTIADNLIALAAQKLGYQNSVEACKTSLMNKDVVVPAGAKLADISGLIDEIEQGSGNPSIPVGVGQHLVTFYDFDGKVLKRQRVNTGEDATAPAIPTHQFLTFAEWNNPFTNVQSDIDTGAIYNTTDGKTYLFITLTPVTGLSPTLFFSKSSTSLMTIDWGDGTTSTSTTSGNQTINHVYATAGDYIITVDNSAGGTYILSSGNGIFAPFDYKTILTKLYYGVNIPAYYIRGLQDTINLKYVTLPNVNIEINTRHFQSSGILHVNIPSSITVSAAIIFYAAFRLQSVIYNKCTTATGHYQNYGLKKLFYNSDLTAIPADCFGLCYFITKYIFLSTTPPTLANINAFSGINPICKIYVPDASVDAYKAATNWNNFSAYIYPLSQKPQSDE